MHTHTFNQLFVNLWYIRVNVHGALSIFKFHTSSYLFIFCHLIREDPLKDFQLGWNLIA